jgi:type IV pilus assembly protein PilB
LPYIALGNHTIHPEVLKLIPGDVVRRDRLVPFDRIGNVLSVVMQNPLNEKMRKEVESLTGCHIATFISTKSDIENAINRFYASGG